MTRFPLFGNHTLIIERRVLDNKFVEEGLEAGLRNLEMDVTDLLGDIAPVDHSFLRAVPRPHKIPVMPVKIIPVHGGIGPPLQPGPQAGAPKHKIR